MKVKAISVTLFALLCICQLYIPYQMIVDKEDILTTGTMYKFKTAPIDPYDPFRGKYVRLRFAVNRASVRNEEEWKFGEEVYVLLTEDDSGYVKLDSAFKHEPEGQGDYLKCKVFHVSNDGENELMLDFPFDKYYMEETKAPEAERVYQSVRLDSNQVAYALVAVKEGEGVLHDVVVNGESIKDIVENAE